MTLRHVWVAAVAMLFLSPALAQPQAPVANIPPLPGTTTTIAAALDYGWSVSGVSQQADGTYIVILHQTASTLWCISNGLDPSVLKLGGKSADTHEVYSYCNDLDRYHPGPEK